MKGFAGSLLVVLMFFGCALVFRPVSKATEDNAVLVTGKITHVFEGSSYDINLRLENNDHHFYINRGLEQGLTIPGMQEALLGNTAEVYYTRHWTPLDPKGKVHHISRVVCDGIILFNEIEEAD